MKKFFRSFSYPEVVWLPKSEHKFLTFICASFIAVMFVTPYPQYAMWAGFLFAAYAAIANDSIQTIGTFIASNQEKNGGYYGYSLVVFSSSLCFTVG